MKNIDLFVYLVLAAVIGIGIYTIYSFMIEKPAGSEFQASSLNIISKGSTDSGDVEIDLTPIKIDGKDLVFSIAINTHSVELSEFDLKKITTLKYNGKTAYPIEAPQIEGHHASGNIVFSVDENLKYFEVVIKGISKIKERIYKWNIGR